jgi:hypothetical protein
VGLSSNIALVVAALDLKLVKLLRDAIRTTDLSGAAEDSRLAPAATFEPRPHIHPAPLIEPRPRIHPMPKYEPRPVIHPQPRIEPVPVICLPVEAASHSKSPFVPPWKVMPWENSPQPLLKIKLVKIRPDIVRKGSLIDCFL